MLRTKVARAETKILDQENGRVSAIVSSESADRDGDIVRVAGWNLKNFLAHPVLLNSHNSYNLMNQIGEWESMEVKGKRLIGTAKFYINEGNPAADWAFNLAIHGQLAFSVGFIPDMDLAKRLDEDNDDFWFFGPFEFNGQELLEVSAVTVPANPDALQRMVKGAADHHPVVAELAGEVLRSDFLAGAELLEDASAVPMGEFSIRKVMEALGPFISDYVKLEVAKAVKASIDGASDDVELDEDAEESTETDEDDFGDGDPPSEETAGLNLSPFGKAVVRALVTPTL